MKQNAITNCRVSTSEQKLSNSLNRQQQAVIKAAQELEVTIIKEWSGDVSSKAGTNVNRIDIREMLEYCKKYRSIKYLIVDEPDRFMRSVDEAFHFEVEFKMIGVKVWYASNPELNTDDMQAKLLRFMKYFAAEMSNEERQRKSISGHSAAVRDGRYTFPPLPGYIKTDKPGVHAHHPIKGKLWQNALKEVSSRLYTPSEALQRLNRTDYSKEKSPLKIDKFLHFIKNPFYCGVIVIGKAVNSRCEKGQHKPMITREEHESILEVVNGRQVRNIRKLQDNPHFPLNKILQHNCSENAKFTGSNRTNGHSTKLYSTYRCRKCNKQLKRDNIHSQLTNIFEMLDYSDLQREELMKALVVVWEEKQRDNLKYVKTLQERLKELKQQKSRLVRELSQANSDLRQDIIDEIDNTKEEIKKLESELSDTSDLQEDLLDFVKFGLEYTNELKDDWWQLNQEERFLCQQLFFPGGIFVNLDGKVSTKQICPLYRLNANKKELDFDSSSLLVERVRKSWHEILDNIAYWRELLYSDYSRHKLNGCTLVQ